MNRDQIVRLPSTINIEEAGALIGLKRRQAYMEARRPGGSIPTIRCGEKRLKVPTAMLLRDTLGLEWIGPDGD